MKVFELKDILKDCNDDSEILIVDDMGCIDFIDYVGYSKLFLDDRDDDKCVILKNRYGRG